MEQKGWLATTDFVFCFVSRLIKGTSAPPGLQSLVAYVVLQKCHRNQIIVYY